ncbi:MAG: gliding motility lipoprotein GldD [Chlorobi bacterium]|nr:gliding motility lipoprotein GldD [Chlorobiota bacterium]
MRTIISFLIIALFVSCGKDPVPKPKAFLRLEYPKAVYKEVNPQLPFTFEKNNLAKSIDSIKVSRDKKTLGIDITYPALKGTIYITYKKIQNNNLEPYLLDAQNITQKHAQKADEIVEQPYINLKHKVFGMLYEVGGNAASQSQFYVTDSINHFVTGSLYFFAKPNYDSILPAANYLKKDIQHIMETIKWKE